MSSDTYLRIDAHNVRVEMERLFEAYPELADDDELRADMIEGSSDMDAVITRAYKSIRQDEAMAEGAKAFKAEQDARQRRFEARAAAKRALILDILDAADLPKRELPIATFSARDPQPSVVVDDLASIPQGYRREKVEADKTAIKKALLAGEDIPGARLELGRRSLSIRGS